MVLDYRDRRVERQSNIYKPLGTLINCRNLNFCIKIFLVRLYERKTHSSGCDTVENINNEVQNNVFIYNIVSRLLGHIVCINLILMYRNLRTPDNRRMPQIPHFIWDSFECCQTPK